MVINAKAESKTPFMAAQNSNEWNWSQRRWQHIIPNEKSSDVNKDDKKTENRTKDEEEGQKSITERALLITWNLQWKGWDPIGKDEMKRRGSLS